MNFLENPNFVYLLLAGGMALGVLALAAPGTGLLELGAFILLVSAGWLIVALSLPVNLWALGVILIGAVLFALSVRRSRQWILLGLSILALMLGSAFLFAGSAWWMPGVHPLLALLVSLTLGGFFWIASRKAIEAEMVRPVHDLSALIGARGEAKSDIEREGSVYVNGELWTARSNTQSSEGAMVKVVAREGLILVVAPLTVPSKPLEESPY